MFEPKFHAPTLFRCTFLLGLMILAGCQSQNLFNNEKQDGLTVEVARIFVEGNDRGTTPQTLRVYRGRKELSVSLRQGRQTVRTFTIEETYSPNAAELDFSFSGTARDGTLRFTVEELPTKDDVNYVIPFYQQPITIDDNQYGLTLIVVDN